ALLAQTNASDPNLASSYVMLAKKEVNLKKNTTVTTGGIGVWTAGKKVKLSYPSTINDFVSASQINISGKKNNANFQQILSPAPAPPLDPPAFTSESTLPDLNIDKNQSGTIDINETTIGTLTIGKNNYVRFTGADSVFIEQLIIKSADKNKTNRIEFSGPTVLVVKELMELGKRTRFNDTETDNIEVFVLNGNVKIETESFMYATLDVRDHQLNVSKASASKPTILQGRYIADKIIGNSYVEWILRSPDAGNIDPYYEPPVEGRVENVIGAELSSLTESPPDFNNISENFIYQVQPDPTNPSEFAVLVEIIVVDGQSASALAALQNLGIFDLIDDGSGGLIISGYLPISSINQLNNSPQLFQFARPVYLPILKNGIATSQGHTAQGSAFVSEGYDLKGAGVKVCVISDSYNNQGSAGIDVAQGDLPTVGVEVLEDFPSNRSDEGRAMLQIIHDIAPEAELAFKTGFRSATQFSEAILDLEQAGCDVIVDDVTYITEPFYKDGKVAQAVEQVAAAGATYVTAAGNYRNNSYSAVFNPTLSPRNVNGAAHNFGNGDIFQKISLEPDDYLLVLQWEDDIYSIEGNGTGGAKIDLDVYLTNENGSTLFGFNRNNIGGDPIEVLP
ncbi:MAG: hypothetical protein AAFO94_13495, partial [Bacteroidota bacterium]